MSNSDRKDIHKAVRDDLLKRSLSNTENFDRSIITLASAALALSVSFVNGAKAAEGKWVLVASWILFVVSILSTLASFLTSQEGIKKQLEIADRYYNEHDDSALKEENKPAEWTDFLSYITAGSFFLAIVFLLSFFSLNLLRTSESKEMSKDSKLVNNGASIPKIERADAGASVPDLQAVERGASVHPIQSTPSQQSKSEKSGDSGSTQSK